MGEVFEELDLGGLKELQELERKELEGKLEKIKVGTEEDNNEDFEDGDFELEEVDEDEDTDFEFEEVSEEEENEIVIDDLEEDEEDIELTEIGTNELSSGATLVEGIDKRYC